MKKLTVSFISLIMIVQFNLLYADTYEEGLDLYNQKKYEEAIDKFEDSVEDGSAKKEEINLFLGNCYFKQRLEKLIEQNKEADTKGRIE